MQLQRQAGVAHGLQHQRHMGRDRGAARAAGSGRQCNQSHAGPFSEAAGAGGGVGA
jgi:hypothetical protein